MVDLLGYRDEVLRALEAGLSPVTIHVRGRVLTLASTDEAALMRSRVLIQELIALAQSGERLTPDAVARAVALTREGMANPAEYLNRDIISARGKRIRPQTVGQKDYVDAIDSHTITFGIGPAGTGKTYLAMAKAVQALTNRQVSRIILTRPAVEAGESLGYLPGSLTDKIDPYVRPLYDAMYDMLDPEAIPTLMAAGTIEVAPLAYMRGRTLSHSFVILDEAQNTTAQQMKMFLTRLGFDSKIVVTGDETQVDLPHHVTSGLILVKKILRNIPDIAFRELSAADVVRHELVGEIVDAYARYDAQMESRVSGARQTRLRQAAGVKQASGESEASEVDSDMTGSDQVVQEGKRVDD
ncbi:MAG: PhoH family protein [Actinomycetaceae bacterium]|nr:PhoH family protein [Actinomycetaceae bacterium]MDY6083133.1 PhoH family protein [Actinomycetaceae bacterium]